MPATNATKNQKQTISLTTMCTEDGMYNKVVVKYVKNIQNVRYEDMIK